MVSSVVLTSADGGRGAGSARHLDEGGAVRLGPVGFDGVRGAVGRAGQDRALGHAGREGVVLRRRLTRIQVRVVDRLPGELVLLVDRLVDRVDHAIGVGDRAGPAPEHRGSHSGRGNAGGDEPEERTDKGTTERTLHGISPTSERLTKRRTSVYNRYARRVNDWQALCSAWGRREASERRSWPRTLTRC